MVSPIIARWVVTKRLALAPRWSWGFERLEAFSDGVMALTITILDRCGRRDSDATRACATKPPTSIYVLAFTLIAIYWNNHHHLLRVTKRISGGVMWANMFLLSSASR